MSLRDAIEQVVQEEERRIRRQTAQTQRVNRLAKPTYMAVVIAKVIVFLNRFKKPAAAPAAPPALKRHLGKQKPPVTIGTLIWEDLTALKRRVFPVKKAKKIPGSNESWKD